jgi:hypothetical protein
LRDKTDTQQCNNGDDEEEEEEEREFSDIGLRRSKR